MFKLKTVAMVLGALILLNVVVKLKYSNNSSTNSSIANNTDPNTQLKRSPASQPTSVFDKIKNLATGNSPTTENAGIKISNVDKSNFNPQVTPPPIDGSTSAGGSRGFQPTANNSSSSAQIFNNDLARAPASSNTATNNSKTNSPSTSNVFLNNSMPATKTSGTSATPPAPNNNAEKSGDSTPIVSNTCGASIVSGAFNKPIGVTLSCAYNSRIKYCIGVDNGSGCCDPHAGSTTYSTQIIVGPYPGNYCLSFYGESGLAGSSEVYQQSYTINTSLPDLQVGHPKINYQTTQLSGKSFITSMDFGKANYNIGQVNLKTHDPSPTALNLSCEEIVTNYVSLPSPAPQSILSLFDVGQENNSQQIEIPLDLNRLDYGDNFITSYMQNNSMLAPIYACSTTDVVLNDFEYFEPEVASSDAGSNTVREFSAGFSSYGFFEPEVTLNRGPAGESTDLQAGMQLQNGLFGIFY